MDKADLAGLGGADAHAGQHEAAGVGEADAGDGDGGRGR